MRTPSAGSVSRSGKSAYDAGKGAIVAFAVSLASFMTGATVDVSGGMLMR